MAVQVTRDWLLMEMGDTNLDDETFAEIAEAAGLPDCCRPQVSKSTLSCARRCTHGNMICCQRTLISL